MSAAPEQLLFEQLAEHWVMTLATREREDADAVPYCTPLFYALVLPDDPPACGAPLLLFASKTTSAHGEHLGPGPTRVSAAIYLETETLGRIQGVQMRGRVVRSDRVEKKVGRTLLARYLKRHPIAAPILAAKKDEKIHALAVEWAKLTDNRIGLGKHEEFRFEVDETALGLIDADCSD